MTHPINIPPTPLPGTGAADAYLAGVCNIGAWEVRRRRVAAWIAFGLAAVLLAGLLLAGAPAPARLLLLFPLWGGLISWLQARRRFCVAFAMGGIANFGDDETTRRTIVDHAQRAADRRTTVRLVRDALLLAIVPTLVAVLLPI